MSVSSLGSGCVNPWMRHLPFIRKVFRSSIGDNTAIIEDYYPVTNFFCLLKHVGGEEDCFSNANLQLIHEFDLWFGSKPSVGSSKINTGGLCNTVWANHARCLHPLESVIIRLFKASPSAILTATSSMVLLSAPPKPLLSRIALRIRTVRLLKPPAASGR